MNNYFPTVIQVNPCNNYSVYVYFDDGKIVLYDMSSKIGKGVFKALQDINVFKDISFFNNCSNKFDIAIKTKIIKGINTLFLKYRLPFNR